MKEDFSARIVLDCPECRVPLTFPKDINAICEHCGFSLIFDDGVWVNPALRDHQADNYCQDIDYVARISCPLTTTSRETDQYYCHLHQIVSSYNARCCALDLGCGDGRFTQYLISIGLERIIAVDLDLLNLRRLAQRFSSKDKEKVILLHADAGQLPIREGILHAIFALGIFNVLVDQFQEVCTHLRGLLCPDGILVNSEPTLEGSLLYALVRHDFDEFLNVATTHTKTIDYDGDRSKRYAVFEQGKVETLLQQSGFLVQYVKGISVFPSLIFGGILQMREYDDDLKLKLANIVDDLGKNDIPVFRVKMYVSKKAVLPDE